MLQHVCSKKYSSKQSAIMLVMGIIRFLIYLAAFGVLSLGSTLIVSTIGRFTKLLRVPPFIFSFFIVGLITSVAEVAVAINAVSINRPEIFIGSMLGGTLVIFLLVIPLMTLLSGGLPVKKHIGSRNLVLILAIITAPAWFTLDQTITQMEGAALIALYASLFFIIKAPGTAIHNVEKAWQKESTNWRENSLLRLALGTVVVFVSSRFIVEETLNYAENFQLSPFIVSLIVIAIGTNLPEIALAIKAATSHELKAEDIAIGDFLGSAAANVLLFGTFTLIYGSKIVTAKDFVPTFLCILLAVISFFAFTRGKSILTVKESIILMAVYGLFVISEFAAA